jgi:hypothetical protein
MNLRNHFSNKPRTLMMIGMSCLIAGNVPSIIHITALNGDAVDFSRGVLIGLSIGFNLLAVWTQRRNARCA